MTIRKIVIASGNEHKVAEFQAIFKPMGIKVIPYKDVVKPDFVMPEETGTTFEENATIKAEAIAKEVGLPVFADDSGFCVNSLQDFPGIRSARFAEEVGGYPQAFAEIEKRLGGKYADAKFVCVIAFVNVSKKSEKSDKTKVFRGVCNGFVTFPARGENGFGYDPIFVPNSYGVTFAEMSEDEKNSISHRANASAMFVKYIEELKAEEEANKGKRVVEKTIAPVVSDVGVDNKVVGESDYVLKNEIVDADVPLNEEVIVSESTNSIVQEEPVVFMDDTEASADVLDEAVSLAERKTDGSETESMDVQRSEVEMVARKGKGAKKPMKVKREKTGMAAFLDVDEEFDAPAVPFSSGDDGKVEE